MSKIMLLRYPDLTAGKTTEVAWPLPRVAPDAAAVGVCVMSRACSTCQHPKRVEIDRRLAAGEPAARVAQDYQINPSSLHRHRTNCLGLGSSNVIMKETARGTAAVALLPSKETL